MIFTEVRFFVFFLTVFVVYWMLRSNSHRKWYLLLASYFFYGAWDYRFLALILLSTAVDYVAALQLVKTNGKPKTYWLLLSLTVNLGMLAIFKYFNFFVDSLNGLMTTVGWSEQISTLEIVLPVGISFYTFQTLSYTIDIYRGKLQPTNNLLDFALFVAFFPQLVAGPIVRASDFLGQLVSNRKFSQVDIRWCFVLFLCGFFKKACLSDNVSPYVDAFYASPASYDAASAICCILLYSVQIYCDFSGYSDMAIATAGLLGFRLRENFEFPYLATNITDFWRRWHMSLSSWLRDYLYIPLGGNRDGDLKANRNLMITMLLGGLWHGASWNFVLWGALHGIALIVHKVFRKATERANPNGLSYFAGWLFTFAFVSLAWVPFRAQGFEDTLAILRGLTFAPMGTLQVTERIWILWAIIPVLLTFHILSRRGVSAKLWRDVSPATFAISYGIAWAITLSTRSMSSVPFIYFQF